MDTASTPILTTKLYVPAPRADSIPRERLLERLDEGFTRRLTLVSAPAGFGKTTLITSWLRGVAERGGQAPRVAWLSLEDDDNVPLRFFSYLIAALQNPDDGIGRTARSLLESPQPPAVTHLMTLLINDLATLTEPTALVLDDFHAITHPELQAGIAFLLEHLPPPLRLILSTREEPSLPLARLRGQGQVTEIRLQELRFTREEAAAFLERTMGLTLGADVVAALESRTEGWIAGLQMAALSLRGREGKPGRRMPLDDADFGGAHRDIIDYLGAEVLRQQPIEIRVFLRQTSILDRLSAPLCDAVTGQQNSRGFLAQLAQANLFLIPLDDERRWYRYHSLFADFLRSELAEWEQRALHQRASQWFEAHGFTPEAIKHALAAPDLEAAERLIRSGVEETFSRGGFNTLLGWLNALPDEVVRARSDLSVDKAWILYLRGDIAEAEEYAAAATQTQRPDDPAVQRGMLLGFRAYLAINRGEPEKAVKLGQEALSLLGDTRSFFRTTALSHLGQAQRLTGDREAAIKTLRQAVTLGEQLGHHLIMLEALGYLTLLLYQQGQLREAVLLCQRAVGQYTDERGSPLAMAGLVLIPLGALFFETNDLERAEGHLKSGIALCEQMGTVYYTLVGQRTLAKLQYARGDTEAAWETLAGARQLAAQSESARRIRMVDAVTAELQLRQGQVAAAARTLAGLPPKVQARSEFENLTVARLLLAQGQPAAALDVLETLERSARGQARLGSLVTIHVLQALAQRALHRHPAALERAEQALSLAAHEGYRRAFLDEGAPMTALLGERRPMASEFVDSLLAAGKSAAGEATRSVLTAADAANQALIEPLGDTQLVILRLLDEGLSNQEIADRVGITLGTTKWHLNQIYGKLGVASRTQALAQARRVKLL
jgi:LuxR family transcriptional regulator, maltose regulon positive regulatory protein